MSASTSDINTERRAGKVVAVPLAAGIKINGGTLVSRNAAGYGVPAADAAGQKVVGIAQRGADNTGGAAGAIKVDVEKTVARLNNSAAHPLVITNSEALVFVEDDNTVSADGGTNNIVAGRMVELDPLDSTTVWVDVSRTT